MLLHRDITLPRLKALSMRRIQAMEETGWHLTHLYRIALTFDQLLTHTLTADALLHQQMQLAGASMQLLPRACWQLSCILV